MQMSKNRSDSKSSFFKSVIAGVLVGLLVIFIFRSNTTQLSDFHWPTAIVLLLVFVLFVGVFLYQMNQIQKSSVPYEDGVLLAPKELIFDDEGINDKTEYGTNVYQWQAVRRIEEHKGHIYIFLDKMLAEIIPAGALGSDEEKKELLNYLKSKAVNIP